MASVRIVTADHYMSTPIEGLDPVYSEFRGSAVTQVPVIRIFGTTKNGVKTCLHVHGVLPYLFIPFAGNADLSVLPYQLASSLDRALNILQGLKNSNAQHVYKITPVSGKPIYGFHRKEHLYLKVFFYNWAMRDKAVALLQNGAVCNQAFQPHEAHVPYILQFFIDYNLYGMSFIEFSSVKYRFSEDNSDYLADINEDLLLKKVACSSFSKLEIDGKAADILNYKNITGTNLHNPGIASLWEEERRRRNAEDKSDIAPPSSQERICKQVDRAEAMYKNKLRQKLQKLGFDKKEPSLTSLSANYPAETPCNADLLSASYLEPVVCSQSKNSSTIGTSVSPEETIVDEDIVFHLTQQNASDLISNSFNMINTQDAVVLETLESLARDQETGESSHPNVSYSQPVSGKAQDVELISMKVDDDSILGTQTIGCIQANDLNEDIHEDLSNVFNNAAVEETSPPRESLTDVSQEGVLKPPHEKIHSLTQVAQKIYDTEDSSVPSENQSFQCENSMSRDGSQKTVSSGNIPQVDGAHDCLDVVSPSEKVLVKKHQQDVLKECKDAFNRYVFSPENNYNSVCSPFHTLGSSSKLGCLSSNKKRMPKRSKPKRRRNKSLPRNILKNLSSESEDCGNDDSTSVCSSSTTELQSHNHVTHVIPRSVIMDIIGASEPTASISENPESFEDCAVVLEPFDSLMDVNDDRPDGWFFESFEDFYKSEGGNDCSIVASNPQKKYPHWPKNERNCDHAEAFNQANATLQCFVNLSLNNLCQENSAGFQTMQSRKELKPVSEIFTPINFSRDVVKDSFSATLSPSFEAPNLETENFPQIIPNNEVKVIVTADVHCVGSKPALTSSRGKGKNVPSRLKKFQAEFLGALSSTSKDAELYEITAAPLEPNKSPTCKTVIPLMRKKPRKRKNVYREKKKKKKIHPNRRNLVSKKCFDVVLPHDLIEKTPWVRDPNSRSCEKMLHEVSLCTKEEESFSPTALEKSLNSNKGLRSSSTYEKSGTSLSTASNILPPEGDETSVFSLKDASGNSLSKTSDFLLQEKNTNDKTTVNFIPLEGENTQPEQFKPLTQNPSSTVENEMQHSFAEAQVEKYGLRKCSVRLERLPSRLSAENSKCNSEVCLSEQELFSKTLCPLKTLDFKSVNLPESISNARMLVSQKVMERSLNVELKTSQTENTAEEKGKIESSNHSNAWNNEESSTKAISNLNISPLSFSADLNESNVTPKILINNRTELQSVQHPSPMEASEFEISFSNISVDGGLNLVNSNESDQSHALSNFTTTTQLSLAEENFSIFKNTQDSESGAVNSVPCSKPGRMKARLEESTLLDQGPIEKQVPELLLCKIPPPKLSPHSLSQQFSPCTVQKLDCSNHLVQNKTTRDETYCYKRYKKNQSYFRSETNALGGVALKSKRLCAIDALKKIKDLRTKIKKVPPDGKSIHCETNLETQNMSLLPVIKSLTKGRLSSSVGCQTDERIPPVWDGPKSLVPYHDVSNIDLLQRSIGTNSHTKFFDQILHSFHRNWYLELQELSDSRNIHGPSFSLSNTSDSSDVKAIMTFRQCNLLPGLTDGTARVSPVDAEDMTSCSKSILGKRKQENKENYGTDVQYGNSNSVVAEKKALVALGNCRVIVERLPCDMSFKADYGLRCVSNGLTPDSSKKVLSQCFHLQKSFSNGSSLYQWALDGTIDLSSDTSDEDLKQNSLKSIQNALENNSQSSNCSDLSDCLSSEKSSPERRMKLRRSKFPKCSVLLKPSQVDRPPELGAKPIVRSACSNNSQSSNEVIVGELPNSSSGNKRKKNQERYQKIITKKQVVTNMSGSDEKLTKLQPVVKLFKLDFQKIKNGISASHADYFFPVVGGSTLTSSQKIRRRRPTYPENMFESWKNGTTILPT